jgi:hypothetical protein
VREKIERGGGGGAPGEGEESSWLVVVSSSPLGPSFIYKGRGAPLPLHQGSRKAAKGVARAAAKGRWGQAGEPPPKP